VIRQSESIEALAAALAQAQKDFPVIPKTHVGKIKGKTKTGELYEYSYHYADLADTVAAATPVLTENGIAVSQFPDFESHDLLTTRVMHKSGQWLEASMRLFLSAESPQAHGSALTYAKRYSYCSAVGIVADEDDDGAAATAAQSKPTTTRPAPRRETFNPATGEITDDPASMNLQTVTAALEALKLPLTGTLEQKRLRLAEHRTGVSPGVEKPDPMFGEP
jgi:hypothetical protein